MKIPFQEIDIKNFLPHRKPCLMVDKWLAVDDKEVTTSFKVPDDCIFVENGYLQEVGLVENAAQTSSTIIGKTFVDSYQNFEDAKPLIGFISSIKKLHIYQLAPVHSTLISKAELISRIDTQDYCVCTIKCLIFQDDICLLSCELNLIIQETI